MFEKFIGHTHGKHSVLLHCGCSLFSSTSAEISSRDSHRITTHRNRCNGDLISWSERILPFPFLKRPAGARQTRNPAAAGRLMETVVTGMNLSQAFAGGLLEIIAPGRPAVGLLVNWWRRSSPTSNVEAGGEQMDWDSSRPWRTVT